MKNTHCPAVNEIPVFSVQNETFEKCSILFKVKEGENFTTGIPLEYFEDENLSLTPRLGIRECFSKVSECGRG